jgi:putative protease
VELVCPAGNLPSLKLAVDNGADSVYVGLKDDTNARHFAGLNFSDDDVRRGVDYAGVRNRRVFMAINTFPQPKGWDRWTAAVDKAAGLGVDTLILADPGLMNYARDAWPRLNLHLSVQASATTHEAIRFYDRNFKIKRVVLPRVLSLRQIQSLAAKSDVPLEVFGFGSLCVMVEGRCLLSSYATGRSPNTFGACSPGDAVRWDETADGLETRLNGVLVDRYAEGENAGYPTVCKGRFKVNEKVYYAIEEPVSLNTLELLPELEKAGVVAIKIEGRQRSPAYVAKATSIWRQALDALASAGQAFTPKAEWTSELALLSEGSQTTFGAYHRPWQ